MVGWSDAILLSQGQSATVRALVSSYVGMTVTIAVDQPPIQITSQWDGSGFQTDFVGQDYIAGYAVSVGEGEVSYLLNYVADAGALSTVTIDAQVKEASVSLAEG
jgi:hypothetical protein